MRALPKRRSSSRLPGLSGSMPKAETTSSRSSGPSAVEHVADHRVDEAVVLAEHAAVARAARPRRRRRTPTGWHSAGSSGPRRRGQAAAPRGSADVVSAPSSACSICTCMRSARIGAGSGRASASPCGASRHRPRRAPLDPASSAAFTAVPARTSRRQRRRRHRGVALGDEIGIGRRRWNSSLIEEPFTGGAGCVSGNPMTPTGTAASLRMLQSGRAMQRLGVVRRPRAAGQTGPAPAQKQ